MTKAKEKRLQYLEQTLQFIKNKISHDAKPTIIDGKTYYKQTILIHIDECELEEDLSLTYNDLVTVKQITDKYGVSNGAQRNRRIRGFWIPYEKINGRIYYLKKWVDLYFHSPIKYSMTKRDIRNGLVSQENAI